MNIKSFLVKKKNPLKGDINIFFFMIRRDFIINKYFMKEL